MSKIGRYIFIEILFANGIHCVRGSHKLTVRATMSRNDVSSSSAFFHWFVSPYEILWTKTSSNRQGRRTGKGDYSRTSRKRPPKMRRLTMIANGRWSLTRIEPQEVSLRRKLDTSTLRKIIYCMQFPSYDMCSSMLLLFLPQEIRNSSGGRLQEVKNSPN